MKVLDYNGLSRFKTKLATIFAPISHTHADKADLSGGIVPLNELPSSVKNVEEYATSASFPASGEAKKMYIAQDNNKVFRWNGSAYVELTNQLALGYTYTTAARGDQGLEAFNHANHRGVPISVAGLYKITANREGHIASYSNVTLSDLTALGVASETDLSSLTRQYYDSIDEKSFELSSNGKIYLIICSSGYDIGDGSLMNSDYGAIILVVNGHYGVIYKGTYIIISNSSNTLTVSADTNIAMAVIEL